MHTVGPQSRIIPRAPERQGPSLDALEKHRYILWSDIWHLTICFWWMTLGLVVVSRTVLVVRRTVIVWQENGTCLRGDAYCQENCTGYQGNCTCCQENCTCYQGNCTCQENCTCSTGLRLKMCICTSERTNSRTLWAALYVELELKSVNMNMNYVKPYG